MWKLDYARWYIKVKGTFFLLKYLPSLFIYLEVKLFKPPLLEDVLIMS